MGGSHASPDYGNPYAQPIGYYITEQTVAGASRYSVFGTTDWLKDIRSVDVRQLPDWIISNYFYNEMSPIIRWLLVPFLILLTVKVLGLIWNEVSVGKRPDPELIHEEAIKHGMEEEEITCLRKWYSTSIDGVQETFGAIISQRSNIWWDARMRRKYALSVRVTLVVIALGLISYGLYEKKDMFEFLAYIVAPLASTYIFGYRQMKEHGDAADRLDRLKEHAEKIWADAMEGKDTATLKLNSRALQDQIFDHRKKNPPIFDFLFRWFRDGNEVLMNKGADVLVNELSGRNC